MDNKIASYGLVGISAFLALALYFRHDSATQAQKVAAEREEKLVGALKVLEAQNTTIRSEADLLTERLKDKTGAAAALSNKVETVAAELGQAKTALATANAAIETVKATVVAAQNETRAVENRAAAERAQFEKAIADYQRAVKDRDTALANVTQANEQMAKQADQLNGEITRQQGAMKDLNAKIAEKEKQLQNAQGERDLLTRELKDLMAKRTELERQLHDLAFLQEQLAVLKTEARTARRFAWAREGTLHDERKGAARLLGATKDPAAAAGQTPGQQSATPPGTGTLRVELMRDGTVILAPK
jgi:chromosome segregation ATPase